MLKVLSGTLKEANKKQKVSEALSPEEKLVSYWDSRYPRVGTQISGLTILDDVPNTSSIAASFDEYIILPGIRDVDDFEISSLGDLFYAADDFRRARQLAEEIRQSGVIKPLIVGIDGSGPHLIEGHHRLGALSLLGIRSFPALIAVDLNDLE